MGWLPPCRLATLVSSWISLCVLRETHHCVCRSRLYNACFLMNAPFYLSTVAFDHLMSVLPLLCCFLFPGTIRSTDLDRRCMEVLASLAPSKALTALDV